MLRRFSLAFLAISLLGCGIGQKDISLSFQGEVRTGDPYKGSSVKGKAIVTTSITGLKKLHFYDQTNDSFYSTNECYSSDISSGFFTDCNERLLYNAATLDKFGNLKIHIKDSTNKADSRFYDLECVDIGNRK